MLKADFLSSFDFKNLSDPAFKEDSVREEIIVPLLHTLGYSASGLNRIVRSMPLAHPFVTIGTTQHPVKIFPDYLLLVDNKPCWVLDAKGPDERIDSGKNVEQVYSYAIHPEVRTPFYALCNGKEFVLFSISQKAPVLHLKMVEIESNFDKIFSILAPPAFSAIPILPVNAAYTNQSPKEFDYDKILLLGEIKDLKKQGAKRHFGVHPYFTKQSWDVVRAYIANFSRPSDVVCDPFGGSGVTAIEALMLKRKAIHIDLNPLAVFITKSLLEPISMDLLAREYRKIVEEFEKLEPKSENEIKKALKKYPHPKGIRLPASADVEFIEQLFSQKQLAQLGLLKSLIVSAEKPVRNTLLLMFSGLINKINLTYHASKVRSEGGGDSSAFRYYRYRIAPEPAELEIIKYLDSRFRKVVAAKKELQPFVGPIEYKEARIEKGNAADLSTIENQSVDYIYTDPPYGAKIQYLDLSIMWTAWLDLKVSDADRKNEAIIGGEQKKDMESYSELLGASIREMYRILKFDRWMSFVFAHKEPAFWHLILDEAEKAGFEYMGAVRQSNGKTTFKKTQNPLTVLCGELIINFKKKRNPRVIFKAGSSEKLFDLVIETIEGIIGRNDGATIEEINDELIMKGLEYGFLDLLSKEYKDLSPFLDKNFDLEKSDMKYHIRPKTKFKSQIDVRVRIRYYLISYMRRCEAEGTFLAFDDLVLNIMPLLKNGITPEKQTILSVLEEVGTRVHGERWKLRKGKQLSIFDTEV